MDSQDRGSHSGRYLLWVELRRTGVARERRIYDLERPRLNARRDAALIDGVTKLYRHAELVSVGGGVASFEIDEGLLRAWFGRVASDAEVSHLANSPSSSHGPELEDAIGRNESDPRVTSISRDGGDAGRTVRQEQQRLFG